MSAISQCHVNDWLDQIAKYVTNKKTNRQPNHKPVGHLQFAQISICYKSFFLWKSLKYIAELACKSQRCNWQESGQDKFDYVDHYDVWDNAFNKLGVRLADGAIES